MQLIAGLLGVNGLLAVVVIVFYRKRLGELRAASWLVALGVFILLSEHPQFSILHGFQAVYPEAQELVLIPHARIHFIMAGIYSLMGLLLLVYIAWANLREGSKSAWQVLFAVLLLGGGSDLLFGATAYQHGSPLYRIFGIEEAAGFGWQFLYVYIISWAAALYVSCGPIFHQHSSTEDGAG